MNSKIEKLREMGCNIEETLERFIDDEEFYIECVDQVLEDKNFELLGEALKNGETKKAFDYAHTLKGIIANTGLQPIYRVIVTIVEPLRAGQNTGLENAYAELIKARDDVKASLDAC